MIDVGSNSAVRVGLFLQLSDAIVDFGSVEWIRGSRDWQRPLGTGSIAKVRPELVDGSPDEHQGQKEQDAEDQCKGGDEVAVLAVFLVEAGFLETALVAEDTSREQNSQIASEVAECEERVESRADEAWHEQFRVVASHSEKSDREQGADAQVANTPLQLSKTEQHRNTDFQRLA